MPSKNPALRLRDIIANAGKVVRYIDGRDMVAFFADEKSVDAVERCLQRISEAAKKLEEQAEILIPDQDWNGIRGIGNHLRHGYDGLDDYLLWQAIQGCSSLAEDCRKALETIGNPKDQGGA
ncbi:MAG: HepT-like ribonuclease domain-containing protein [Rhodomicrobium sp.]